MYGSLGNVPSKVYYRIARLLFDGQLAEAEAEILEVRLPAVE